MKYKETALQYFETFSNKNILELEKMFSDDIVLIDWNFNSRGKDLVVKDFKTIFEGVDTIQVNPIIFYFNSDHSYAVRIEITINDEEKLEVIDTLKFNDQGLINYIEAYTV